MYVDHELSGRCNGPDKLRSGRVGAAFFASEPQLGAIAERRLKAIGWEFGPLVARKRLPKANNNGEIGESIIFLKFYERPHGFSAEGAGNMVEIGLDSLTGEIVEMMRFIGYRSGPASLNVTRARAIEVARSATSLSASPIVIGPIYRQLSVQETLSKRGREFCRNKMLVLSYCIVGRQEVLVIAADTGEIVSRRSSARG